MAQELKNDTNDKNQVCVIKPVRIELEGIYELFNLSVPHAEKGNLVQSLWKFLIYTELAFDTYKILVEKPAPMLTQYESDLVKYVEKTKFIQADFSVRMEHAIREICGVDLSGTIADQRHKVSQILHENVLAQLRILLGRILSGKEKVFILIDNLDRAWKVRDDLSKLADFLFGLLRVSEVIATEFRQSDTRKQKVELALVIFLRSDIFSYIRSYEQEQDKLNTTLINWTVPQLLLRVVEERIRSSLTGLETAEEIWERYFAETVHGIPTKHYILSRVLPRPRDIILFCRQARFHAINHVHERIEEEDILQAEKNYGQHTWYTLLSETQPEFPEIENLLTQFMGENEIITRDRLEELLEEAGIPKKNLNRIVDLLCEANFLGLEVDLFEFDFVYDDRLKHRRTLAKKRAKQIGIERYKINPAFHAFFEMKLISQYSLVPCNYCEKRKRALRSKLVLIHGGGAYAALGKRFMDHWRDAAGRIYADAVYPDMDVCADDGIRAIRRYSTKSSGHRTKPIRSCGWCVIPVTVTRRSIRFTPGSRRFRGSRRNM